MIPDIKRYCVDIRTCDNDVYEYLTKSIDRSTAVINALAFFNNDDDIKDKSVYNINITEVTW